MVGAVGKQLSTWAYFGNGASYVQSVVWENRWRLAGTAGAWFILDVVFYANGLFSGQITSAMGLGSSIKAEAISQLILQVCPIFDYINMSPIQFQPYTNIIVP